MITKGIIEELISPYEVRVRIPILDRSDASSLHTTTQNLNIATICSLPNCYVNLQVGDVVFVGFEDNTYYKAVILGHLCRETDYTTYADVTLGNMIVKRSAELPQVTSIGEVTDIELQRLVGIRENIQKQIDNLSDKLENLQDELSKLTKGS